MAISDNKPDRIALLGGTFNPVHNGHLRLALDVLQQGFDEVRLIPNAIPPHRGTPQASPEARLAMLKLALEQEPELIVDTQELDRQESPSYSLHTVSNLIEASEQAGRKVAITWVMGSDAFAGLNRWYGWERFVTLANVLVIKRPGYDIPAQGPIFDWFQANQVASFDELLSSTSGACYSSDLRVLAISATEIRQLVAEGRSPRYLLPEGVLRYISKHQLYHP